MQTMAIYMTALGMTLGCDGWRFEPVPFETYKLVCRGQVTPQSRELVYEVFVREVIAGPEPTLFADLLCTVDGLPAFHCRRMGLRALTRMADGSWVSKSWSGYVEPKPVAEVATAFSFDYKAMLPCAIAQTFHSRSVRSIEKFDSHRKVARLPGPPYHFMSRVTELVGEIGVAKSGAEVVAEYDVPSDAWYFAANGLERETDDAQRGPHGDRAATVRLAGRLRRLPLGLRCRPLLPQPRRNGDTAPGGHTLDGDVADQGPAEEHRPGGRNHHRELRRRNLAHDEGLVYSFDTVFGYFRREALQQQVGLPVTDEQRSL